MAISERVSGSNAFGRNERLAVVSAITTERFSTAARPFSEPILNGKR